MHVHHPSTTAAAAGQLFALGELVFHGCDAGARVGGGRGGPLGFELPTSATEPLPGE